jgi:hypothetical protein
MLSEQKRLGEILVNLQALTPAQVEQILEAMRRRRDQRKFGEVAREMGLLQEEHVLAALAVQLEMFPGISNLSLRRLLDQLQAPTESPPRPRRRTGATGRRK